MLSSIFNSVRQKLVLTENCGIFGISKYCSTTKLQNGTNQCTENENLTEKRARLFHESVKRGKSENGKILRSFAGEYITRFDKDQLRMYDELLNKPSDELELYYWATGVKDTPKQFYNEVMELLKRHAMKEIKKRRYKPPFLN